jgi:hypothetical protein
LWSNSLGLLLIVFKFVFDYLISENFALRSHIYLTISKEFDEFFLYIQKEVNKIKNKNTTHTIVVLGGNGKCKFDSFRCFSFEGKINWKRILITIPFAGILVSQVRYFIILMLTVALEY